MKFLASKAAKKYNIEERFLLSLIELESGWNPWAVRNEPGYAWYYNTPKLTVKMLRTTLVATQKMSYGLMQTMGSLYYEYGYTGYCTELFNPELNLEIGCKHIVKKYNQYGPNPADVYAAYNAGSVRKTTAGKYVNWRNVESFMKIYDNFNLPSEF